MTWPEAFLLTILFELPVYAVALGPVCARRGELALLTVAANMLTHPALWGWSSWARPGLPALCAAESMVSVAEGLFFAAYLARRSPAPPRMSVAVAAAFSANAFSWGAGWLALGWRA